MQKAESVIHLPAAVPALCVLQTGAQPTTMPQQSWPTGTCQRTCKRNESAEAGFNQVRGAHLSSALAKVASRLARQRLIIAMCFPGKRNEAAGP